MHPEQLAFIDRILSDPDDDTVRLVFADWLEDHDQADRAVFIRNSINGVEVPEAQLKDDGPEYELTWEDRGEISSLVGFRLYGWDRAAHKDTPACYVFDDNSPVISSARTVRVGFDRGMPARIKLTTESFLSHAGLLFKWNPISQVILADKDPTIEDSYSITDSSTGITTSGHPMWYSYDRKKPRQGMVIPRHWIPNEIGKWLTLRGVGLSNRPQYPWYENGQEARADLSRCCVEYGRERAEILKRAEVTDGRQVANG